MKQPIIPMTLQQWIFFATNLKYGDMLFVFDTDFTGALIEWGSGDNSSPDIFGYMDYLHPVHAFRYLGLGRGATVEADPQGSKYHLIDEYRDRVISGKTRIIVNRHIDLSVEEFNYIKAEADSQVGKPYGFGAILGFGLYRLFRDTFIGGWIRAAKWQTPFCDRNAPVCSQGVRLQEDNVKRFYNNLIKLSTWEKSSPQVLFENINTISDRVTDTFLIGAKNKYDYIKDK